MIDLQQVMVMTVIPLRRRSRRRPHTSTSPPQLTLVEQWASLLELLWDGCASISTSAEQMAEDLPRDLIGPVNAQLRQQGCAFQVQKQQTRTPRSKHQVQRTRRRVERGSDLPRPASNG
ncbi:MULTISPECIES: hypothetical protein [unclassified Synechococcus]|uniref:hypothetical protein n=1 Tax=unclassified Synechococcus TaxID=2626047 RepID=UPI002000FAA7|nr:hypothetical protein [Synechococcus sp. A10-1-5-1]UPM49530.1 hypothetical protein MY494_09290 [Synechococcus sp. A10-1-5-1]